MTVKLVSTKLAFNIDLSLYLKKLKFLIDKVQFNDLVFEYLKFGKGEKFIISFHGFGMHASDFRVFEETLGSEYTFISINHFHHGNSYFPLKRLKRKPFKRSELKNLIDLILEKHNIDKFSIAGFSLGGRLALCTFELFPTRVEKLYLFAPDGVNSNTLYQIVSRTILGQQVYKFLIDRPNLMIGIVGFLKSIRVFNERFYNFILFHIDTDDKRKLLYNIWMTYRLMHPIKRKFLTYIKKYDVKLNLFLGKHDMIVPPQVGKDLSKRLKGIMKLHIIFSGHNILSSKTNRYLAKNIYKIDLSKVKKNSVTDETVKKPEPEGKEIQLKPARRISIKKVSFENNFLKSKKA